MKKSKSFGTVYCTKNITVASNFEQLKISEGFIFGLFSSEMLFK